MSAAVQRKRPSAAGKHRGHISTASHYEGRYLEEILHAGTFNSSTCFSSSSSSIPFEFASLDEYVSTFDPLVLEEAREGIRSGYLENTAQGGFAAAGVVSKVEEVGSTNRAGSGNPSASGPSSVSRSTSRPTRNLASKRPHIRVTITGASSNSDLARLDLKNNVAVFEFLPIGSSVDQNGNAHTIRVPGLCVSSSVQSGLVLKVYKTCKVHKDADNPPCSLWFSMLGANASGTTVTVTKATQLTSSEREFDALHSVKNIDSSLMRYILKPSLLVSMREVYETNRRRELWPREARQEPFVKFLKAQYDRKQLEAIEMTACQLAVHSSSSAVSTDLRASDPSPSFSSLSTKLPFVLIQGPPGTGKTHTVCGVLNVWHLTAYQQYYENLIRSVKDVSMKSGSGLDSVAAARRWGLVGSASRKPRILVCTPSNAACDELMARVMRCGFCDGRGKMYWPNIVRIGGDAAVDVRVKERFLGTLVKAYTDMTEEEWHQVHQAKQTLLVQKKQQVRQLEMSLTRVAHTEAEMTRMAQQLLGVLQDMERAERQVEKLAAAWPSIAVSTSSSMSRRNLDEWQSKEELKTILLSEAEMVFSTLSSTQQKIFKEAAIRAPFHTVLIDEAGQASEVSALQPLTAGAKSIVLVGDPQQLPATIKSDAARAVEMERSLFERLQAKGCPVALLSVQYRMHPEIRRFPSKHFYKDKLEDAPSVTRLPPESFHAIQCLGPYQVFDVASGKEERSSKSSSLSNLEESRLACCLFMKLRRLSGWSVSSNPSNMPSIAVVTPYRQQRTVLRQTFKDLCGDDSLKHVAIETIDSYQGRQVDVVILSCVRAGFGGGLGFVTDVRRMNVAITRARRSLWILGALETLKKNKEWGALIEDAEKRRVVVTPTEALGLLTEELAFADKAKRKSIEGVATSSNKAATRVVIASSNCEAAKMKVAKANPKPMKKARLKSMAAGMDTNPGQNPVLPMRKARCIQQSTSAELQSRKPMTKDSAVTRGTLRLEGTDIISNDPFDPIKPRATTGKSARRRKRKGGSADGDQAAIDAADSFTVSARFPQPPPEGR